ncbi:MAG TPA: NAD(P)H-hydrate dehydratase [Planctomycetota bacterium]|nr:NAD(P)H-hydrate dehydratase [Planctomycetota bacterium]
MKIVRTVARLRPRQANAHKGDFGTVLVVAGSEAMLGAAVLCANGALRGGAGLVQVALPAALQPLLPIAVPGAVTLSRHAGPLQRAVSAATAIVAGPGLGMTAATRALVRAILRGSRGPVVLDADALNVLAPLETRPRSRSALVLTPHPGEAGRLLGSDSRRVQADRAGAVQALCKRSGAVVVLKGAGTLVCDGTRCYTNRTGNPGMATGGSGDVLAGLLGALLAQGLLPFEAACLAVETHGRAGDLVAKNLGQRGLLAQDLPLAIAQVLR